MRERSLRCVARGSQLEAATRAKRNQGLDRMLMRIGKLDILRVIEVMVWALMGTAFELVIDGL